MKFYCILLSVLLSTVLVSSCSDACISGDGPLGDDIVAVSTTVSEAELLPQCSRTSAEPQCQLRFILEVWEKDAAGEATSRVVRQSLAAQEGTAEFAFRLTQAGRYRILLWADYIALGADAESDLYYCTNPQDGALGLKKVQLNTADYSTSAMRDAFCSTIDFERKEGEGLRLPICPLKRAAARLALYEKEEAAYLQSKAFAARYAVPCEYDVEKGQVSDRTFHVSVHEPVAAQGAKEGDAWRIFQDHILVPSNQEYTIPEVALTGYDLLDKEYENQSVGLKNVKLSRNKTTKILGSYVLVSPGTLYQASFKAYLDGANISLSPWFGSFNGRSSEGPGWTNSKFVALANWMSPALVRYPGGTLANSWDWRQGGFMGKNIKYPYLIKDFAPALSAQSDVVYVMNMVNPTPATGYYGITDETELKSDECLQAKINDLFEALAEFEKYGHLPVAVELGNELYFNNPDKYSDYGIYMGNPALYMQHARVIAKAIKGKYPQMNVLLCTSKSGNGSNSNPRDFWNNTVYSSMDDEMYALTDGFVQHHYIKKEMGSQAVIEDDATAEQMIAEGFNYAAALKAKDYALIPAGKKLWITEFGLEEAGNALCDRWVTALEYYAMTTSWFDWADKIQTVMLQHITLTPGVLNEAKDQLSSLGIVYGELLRAMRGRNIATAVKFAAVGDEDTAAIDRLSAWSFSNPSNPEDRTLVVVNPTATPIELVDLTSVMAEGCAVKQYWSDTPYADMAGSPVLGNGINLDNSQHAAVCSFPAFSMTVFGAE